MSFLDQLQKLAAIPAGQPIPAPAAVQTPPPELVRSVVDSLFPTGPIEINPPEPKIEIVAAPQEAPAVEEGDECPHCHKRFKHLSRHKCQRAPVLAPQEIDQRAEQAPAINPTLEALQSLPEKKPLAGALPDAPQVDVIKFFDTSPTEKDTAKYGHYVLLLDCVITDHALDPQDIIPLADIVTQAQDKLERHWKLYEYGSGAAVLCDQIKAWFAKHRPIAYIIASSRTIEYSAVSTFLEAHADYIIRGVA